LSGISTFFLIILTHQLPPSVFSKTLARGRAPLHARRRLFAVDVLAALLAFETRFIRENLDERSATRALVNSRTEIFALLAGAFSSDNITY
jgi:hypothetical protein